MTDLQATILAFVATPQTVSAVKAHLGCAAAITPVLMDMREAGLIKRVKFNDERCFVVPKWAHPKPAPLRLLPLIKSGPPMHSREIAEKLGVGHRRIKSALSNLHGRGLIKRHKVGSVFCYVPAEFELNTSQLVASVLRRTDEVGDCRIWNMALDPQGNPLMRFEGNNRRVQNVLWKAAGNDLPADRRIIMKCGCKDCILLEHMKVVHRRVPFQLAAKAGKWRGLARAEKLSAKARERFGKFTPEDIAAIRSSHDSQAELALRYGVVKSTIGQIQRFETYKEYRSVFSGLMNRQAA
ncbi:MAG TPA: hypothetical protein VMS38_19355 [Pseudorhodoferax sp.]|nr:hypothetical protein [Pseudorhodoferax sp.]